MNTLIELVAQHAGLIALGSSLLLAVGALAMVCCASPAHRLRLGMLSLAGVLVWLPLAFIPCPRPDLLALLRHDAAAPPSRTDSSPTAPAGGSHGLAGLPHRGASAWPLASSHASDEPPPSRGAAVTRPQASHRGPSHVPALPELAPGQADMAAAGVPRPAERQPALRRVEADASASLRGAGASAALRSHNAAGGPSLRRLGALVTITGSACIVWLLVGHALLARLRGAIPDLVLRTTMIVGFPGETESHYQELEDFVRAARFERLGVFTYSYEADTPSARLPDHLDEQIKAARRDRLMEAQQEVAFAWARAQVGRRREVLLDAPLPGEPDVWLGRSYSEAPDVDGVIYVTGRRLAAGKLVPCEIVAAQGYDLVAAPVGPAR